MSRKEREQAEVDAKRKAEDDAEAKLRREREQKVLTRHMPHRSFVRETLNDKARRSRRGAVGLWYRRKRSASHGRRSSRSGKKVGLSSCHHAFSAVMAIYRATGQALLLC